MKIQLDTKNKTIKIEENIKLDKFFETLNKILPNKEWKNYTLETNTIIERWSNPIIIREVERQTYPWYRPVYTADHTPSITGKYTNGGRNSGTYNIEC